MKYLRLSGSLVSIIFLASCASSPTIEFDPGNLSGADSAEARAYEMGKVSSAEELYGTNLEDTHPAYQEAVAENPRLGYNVFYFAFNSDELSPETLGILEQHAEFINDHPEVTIIVEGHTDKQGTAGYNLALGELRGKSIERVLIDYGVEVPVRVVSYGEERPAVEGDDESIYSRNRRAELIYR